MWGPHIKQCRFSHSAYLFTVHHHGRSGLLLQCFDLAMAKHHEIMMILPYFFKVWIFHCHFSIIWCFKEKKTIGFHKPQLSKLLKSKWDFKHCLIIRVLCHQPCRFSAVLCRPTPKSRGGAHGPSSAQTIRDLVDRCYSGISGTFWYISLVSSWNA